MHRHCLKPVVRVAVALVLGLMGATGSLHAQVRSSGAVAFDASFQHRASVPSTVPPSSATDPVPLSSSPLNPYGSLEKYIQQSVARPLSIGPTREGVLLSRRGKLFWGTVGLVLSGLCTPRMKRTDFIELRPVRTPDRSGCKYCEQESERAFDAVLEGLFGTRP